MTSKITVYQKNAAFIQLDTSEDLALELWDKFAFEVPGAKFHPLVKQGRWDGKIRLFHLNDRTIYSGLLTDVFEYCQAQGYEFDMSNLPVAGLKVLEEDFEKHAKALNLPKHIELRDYQRNTWLHATRGRAALELSPTASGKSLVIYMIATWIKQKTIIIVPRTQLVNQFQAHLIEYGCDPDMIHTIPGSTKDTNRMITISTWQSLLNMPAEWFEQFETVFVDEAHGAKAASITGIMEKLTCAFNRFGFTGTLDGSKTHETALRGLFGPVYRATTTRELMDSETIAKLDIHIIKLEHPEKIKKYFKGKITRADGTKVKIDYATEYSYLVKLEARNRFIARLAAGLKGNTMVLFNRIEDQGDILQHMIPEETDRPFYYVHGKVTGADRDTIRLQVRKETNAIFLASFGTTSTGTDIPEVDNIIFASPWKSVIVNLQSIGRGLRRTADKTKCNLYDVADDLSTETKSGNINANHTLRHMEERVKIYCKERFNYRIYPVQLEYD